VRCVRGHDGWPLCSREISSRGTACASPHIHGIIGCESLLVSFTYLPPPPSLPCLAQSVSKTERAAAPIFAVIDAPDKVVKDKGYLWIEVRMWLEYDMGWLMVTPVPSSGEKAHQRGLASSGGWPVADGTRVACVLSMHVVYFPWLVCTHRRSRCLTCSSCTWVR
jgi:hypothetical protein